MALLNIIKTNENLRKLFGKRELIIIQKQLLGLKLTQSEKNRLSRDIRKKLDAIKEISQFSSEFELKHGAEIKEIINESLEIISHSRFRNKIKRVVLFGSTGENTRTLNSDIDLAVEFSEINNNEATQFRLDIMKKTDNLVDIQIYNILPDKIKKEIDTKGRLLFL